MIFRQLFDSTSGTYTYLLASRRGGEALIIDPVLEQVHAPYPDLPKNVTAGGMLHELACAAGKRIVFYCAFRERSAMAVQAAQDAGIASACHLQGGFDAWIKANGRIVR
jgi:rhodanese-related sulfurtransferase